MRTTSLAQSTRTRVLHAAIIAILATLIACAPDPVSAWEPDYWLVLEPGQGSGQLQPAWARRTIPIPVVRSIGIDISRLHPPRPARLFLIGSDVNVPIVTGKDRYEIDITVGFRGLEPYQRTYLIIGHPNGRGRHWQASLMAVPKFESEQP